MKATDIFLCKRIQVTRDESGILDFTLQTDVFDTSLSNVTIIISVPRVVDDLILVESSVQMFTEEGGEIETPPSWRPDLGLEKTLATFIAVNSIGVAIEQSASEVKTEIAIGKIKRNIELAADFIAKTLFFCMKGLSDDDIDRARVTVIDKITEKIIHYRNISKKHAGEEN